MLLLLTHQSLASSNDELHCLAKALYFEAYQGADYSKKAVGWVILNRQGDSRFPRMICEIIHQPGQFPWTKSPIKDAKEYEVALKVAKHMLQRLDAEDPTKGALFFASILDDWFYSMIVRGKFIETVFLGGHRFFRWDVDKPYYE